MDRKEEPKRYRNFINGKWCEPESGEYYTTFSPGDRDLAVGSFPLSNSDDAGKAVRAADERFTEWKNTSPSERTDYIYRFIDLLDENKEELAKTATLEQGKVLKESKGEPARGVKELTITAGEALRLEGIARPSDSKRTTNIATRLPIGVVAAISPWNFPILTPLRKIIPALVSGCTVVLKPATATPLACVLITELLEKTGMPPGAMNLVIGSGSKIGDALTGNPLVKGITFTGSTLVGQRINETASKNFTKVQLEMGGKNAAVVADYDDIENIAPKIVKAAFTNAGQRCTSISRVIVMEHQADELTEKIVAHTRLLKLGNGFDPETDIGPLINSGAVESMERYIESAVLEGAVIAAGGKIPDGEEYRKGFYFEPTVLTDVTKDMRVAKEEIFGPILVIIKVKTRQEAIDVCNATEYGLTASLFSDNMSFTYDFTENVDVGMVRINNLGVSGGNMPFGGVKKSGLGPFSIGNTNMDFYTNTKVTYIEY